MDTKIELTEGDPLEDDVSSQNDRKFLTKNVEMNTNSNTVLQDDYCDMTIKMEIKSEAPLPDLGSQNERIFLQEDPVRKDEKYSHNLEMDNSIEIKEEYWWLRTETSSVFEEIKDEDFTSATCPRSCIEAVYDNNGKSPLPSAEVLEEDKSLYKGRDNLIHGQSTNSEGQGTYVTEENTHLEQSINHNNSSKASCLNQKNIIHEVQRLHKCAICEKSFNKLSNLKRHYLSHEGKKPHKCAICEKRFTQLSSLKNHNLIHEGRKPHKCEICEKRFTELSNLKSHNLIHEGKKPYKCTICEMRFTQLSGLKRHNLIHEGKKPHKCAICEKRFTQLWNLKAHSLIHEAKKSQV